MKIEFVENARRLWRSWSVLAMLSSAGMIALDLSNALSAGIPAIAGWLPPEVLRYCAFGMLGLGTFGRFVKQRSLTEGKPEKGDQ